MSCPSALEHCQYVDAALPAESTAAISRHVEQCASCQRAVARLRAENLALGAALQSSEAAQTIPEFAPQLPRTQLFAWLGLAVIAALAIHTAWQGLHTALLLPAWLDWLVPSASGAGMIILSGLAELARSDELMAQAAETAATLACGLACAVLVLIWNRRTTLSSSAPLCLAALSAVLLMASPADSYALEFRHDDTRLTISADEVIDDTVIAASERVTIEGHITGDLLAAGERVIVRGQVDGTVFAFAEVVEIDASIRGNVISAGERVNLRKATLSGNLYAAGEKVTVHDSAEISGNAIIAGQVLEQHGRLGLDLIAAGEKLSVAGKVERKLRFYGGELELVDDAHVGASLYARVASEAQLQIADTATVLGETSVETWPEEPSQYSRLDYYFEQLMKLLAAFLFGLALFWLLPSLRQASAAEGRELLYTAALGALALVATPVLSVLAIATLLGAPLGIAALLLWVIALYTASVLTAVYVGDSIMSDTDNETLSLFVGLLILTVLFSLPVAGGLLKFAAVLLGLGMIVRWIREG